MNNQASNSPFNEASPSVQAHLGILQNVIERMATNSTSAKTWCITIVSAIIVVIADKNKSNYALIALIPTVLFVALDAYYLAMEKGFRNAYNQFVKKIHGGSLTTEDLFSVRSVGNFSKLQLEALMSFSVWGFYSTLALLILCASFILGSQIKVPNMALHRTRLRSAGELYRQPQGAFPNVAPNAPPIDFGQRTPHILSPNSDR